MPRILTECDPGTTMLRSMSRMIRNATTHCPRHSNATGWIAPTVKQLDTHLSVLVPVHATKIPRQSRLSSKRLYCVPVKLDKGATSSLPPTVSAAGPAGLAADQQSSKLLLIDGHNLAFRAYWGMWQTMANKGGHGTLSTSDGIPTTVTFGFLRSLTVLLEEEQPDALIVAFDAPVKSFRHELLPEYKSNRAKAPPGFGADLRNLQQLLRFMRVYTVTAAGYEADDLMAGVAMKASRAGFVVRVYSSDMDLYQIVDDAGQVAILRPAGAPNKPGFRSRSNGPSVALMDAAAVIQRLGVLPAQVADYKALAGDSSDNVPGIPGIGAKTAAELLKTCGDVGGVFQHLDSLKKGVAAKLQGKQEEAERYRDITILRPEAVNEIDLDLQRSQLRGFSIQEVEPLLRRLEMMKLVQELPRMQLLLGGAAAPDPELAAAVPAAVDKLADWLVQQQSADESSSTGSAINNADNDSGSRSLLAKVADAAGNKSFRLTGTSGAVLAPRSPPFPDAVNSLPHGLLQHIPDVNVITTQQQLQQMIPRLQAHKGPTSWSWPQSYDYRPGVAPQLPSYLCCMWDQLLTAEQVPLVDEAAAYPADALPNGRPAADTPEEADTVYVVYDNTSLDRRRRRRTRASTSRSSSTPVVSAAIVKSVVAPLPQQQLDHGEQYYRPQLALVVMSDSLPAEVVLTVVQPLLESASCPKIMFESKRCYTELRHWGIRLEGVESDVLVAGCLLDPERWKESTTKNREGLDALRQQHSALPTMTRQMLNTSLQDLSEALRAFHQHRQQPTSISQQAAHDQGATDDSRWQAAAEVWASHALRGVFESDMRQLGDDGKLMRLLKDVEVPVQRVLSDMEFCGLGVDRDMLLQQKQQLQETAHKLERQLYELAGEEFNIQARHQLSRIIYDKLQLKPRDSKYVIPKTASGVKATGMEHIEKLEDSPFKNTYKEWLHHNTLLTRYYTPSYMDAATPETGRVHTILHQVGGATGRINSSHPNLQNLPMHDPRAADIRRAFNRPAEGYVLVSADYSQVELRVLAALSGDQALQEALKGDVHAATARVLLQRKPEESITPEDRQLGKRVNFSIAYGAGARNLAAGVAISKGDIGFTEKDGRNMLDKFFAAYPGLLSYMTHNQRSGVAHGYTQSYLGRRRLFKFQAEGLRGLFGTADLDSLPDMKGLKRLAKREDDSAVLRQAGNAPIQGTSADVLKLALLQLHQKLTVSPYNCRLLLTVHDEVVMEVPQTLWPGISDDIKKIMEGVLPLMLKVEVEENW